MGRMTSLTASRASARSSGGEAPRRFLFLLALPLLANDSIAWTITSSAQSRPGCRSGEFCKRGRSLGPLFSSNDGGVSSDSDDPVLTDLDARVLQSMLQDEKLNLQEEENMKRLLERGIKSKEPVAQEAKKAAKSSGKVEGEYASQVLQTLGDTKLWKGLSRNAADWFESAKIWIENKVERDTKLVASLGIFAFERAVQDVKRALPAASAAAAKVAPKFLLDVTSSANENRAASSEDIRNQMTTPKDEIKSVTQEIKYIIQSGGERVLRSSGGITTTNNRGLQSAATSKMGKDRFLKAYQRRKQTTLLREKENIAQKGARMAGSVMDSAYQVKRELQIEPNQPGYKTKALREGAAQTSKFLASGAKGFLSGARAVAQAALPNTASPTQDASGGGMAATDAAMNAAMGRPPTQPSGKKPITPFIDATIVDASVIDMTPTQPKSIADAPINARIPWTSAPGWGQTSGVEAPSTPTKIDDFEQSSVDDLDDESFFFASRTAPDFQQEKTVSSLLKDKTNDGNEAPTRKPLFSYYPPNPAEVNTPPANTEGQERFDGESSSTFADALADSMPDYVDVTPEILEAVLEAQARRGAVPFGAEVDPSLLVTNDEDEDEDFLLDDEDPRDTLRRVMAEIVTDEDFEVAVGSAKRVDNTAGQDVEDPDEDKEPSLLVVITLRLLDIVFLVLEKILLAVPTVLSSIPTIASRVAITQNAGMGSEGWETISNAQRGERRY